LQYISDTVKTFFLYFHSVVVKRLLSNFLLRLQTCLFQSSQNSFLLPSTNFTIPYPHTTSMKTQFAHYLHWVTYDICIILFSPPRKKVETKKWHEHKIMAIHALNRVKKKYFLIPTYTYMWNTVCEENHSLSMKWMPTKVREHRQGVLFMYEWW